MCMDVDDNELIALETLHHFVVTLDQYFGNVCELDIIFNFHRVYFIVDELFMAGELQVRRGLVGRRENVIYYRILSHIFFFFFFFSFLFFFSGNKQKGCNHYHFTGYYSLFLFAVGFDWLLVIGKMELHLSQQFWMCLVLDCWLLLFVKSHLASPLSFFQVDQITDLEKKMGVVKKT